ncbi:MAG: Rpn family recombination-promoting nuclease/putative transposase [Faecalibacillus sp.]
MENHNDIDKSTPIRYIIYDILHYYNHYQNQNKLLPVFTIVFYIGEKKWNVHGSLKEIMEDMPEELGSYFNVYRIIFVDLKDNDIAFIKGQETRDMINANYLKY